MVGTTRGRRCAGRSGPRLSWVIALAVLGWLSAPATAIAACPAFEPDNTWLGVLGGMQERKLTAEQGEALLRQGVIPRFPVTLWPPSGPAPLTVGVVWWMRGESAPEMVEIDADGDGVPEVSDAREENLGYTFPKPGQFPATIRVRERGGRVMTYAAPVTVLTPEAFDAELQGRWTTLKAALRKGDFAAAFECVHSQARRRHERALRSLLRREVEVDQELPPIRFRELQTPEAAYVTIRPRPRHTKPSEVLFQPDLDGVWRLTSVFGRVP